MAVAKHLISCSICLGILEHPVTIPCGHSYCMGCITRSLDQEDDRGTYKCPQCRQTFTPRPVLNRNTMFFELVEHLKKTSLQASPPGHYYAGPGDVEWDFCTGRKLKAVKSCLVCLTHYCGTHLQPHYEVPPLKKHTLVQASTQLQEKICSHLDKLQERHFCADQQCICYLFMLDEDKGHDTISAAAEKFGEKHQECQKRIQEGEKDLGAEAGCGPFEVITVQNGSPVELNTREDFLRYSCRLTFDPNTANQNLCLSEGNRKVTYSNEVQSYPDHPDRFTFYKQVLCREGQSGVCYWEVDWSGEQVGVVVSYKEIGRKDSDNSCFGFNDQSWRLYCSRSRCCFYHNNDWTDIMVPCSSRVGVYLDHIAGILSFYSVSDQMTFLHRVQTTFKKQEPLCPGVIFSIETVKKQTLIQSACINVEIIDRG